MSIEGTYYVIREKKTGRHVAARGVSSAPHLYTTFGKAEGMRKQKWQPDNYESVPVQLTLVKEGATQA